MSEHLPAGGIDLSPADVEALESRWAAAWTPEEVARRLAGVVTPWCVAAGWALDLFCGGQSRAHGDLEIAIPAANFAEIRGRFSGYVFDGVGDHRIWEDAAPEVLAATHQTWLRDPVTGNYLVDVFREPHDGDIWICRRDDTIRLPYAEIIQHTADGIPYLIPELVLLFKAKHVRPKDQADFESVLPYLNTARRRRLSGLLAQIHPGHRWLTSL